MLDNILGHKLLVVLTTIDDEEKALFISQEILKKRLAACISCREIKSTYWWNHKINSSKEYELMIKTLENNLNSLKELINHLHPYELPEILSWESLCSKEYYEWLNSNC